jgi:hypothetical protein
MAGSLLNAAGLMRLQASAGNSAVCALIAGRGQDAIGGSGGRPLAVQRRGGTYWQGPEWGGFKKKRGGTFMKVRMGPDAADSTSRGSTPKVTSCTNVNDLNQARYRGYTWIKGHLLNENLGGPGNSENLTPLTAAANSDHKNTFEAPIKIALSWSKGRSTYHLGDTHWYGVYYEVRVSGHEWPTAKERFGRSVARRLDCKAVWIAKVKNQGAKRKNQDAVGPAVPAGSPAPPKLPPAQLPAGSPPLPQGVQSIDCVQ